MGKGNFTEEFKRDAVRQITERGYPVAEVSQRLGVSPHSLYEWKVVERTFSSLGHPAGLPRTLRTCCGTRSFFGPSIHPRHAAQALQKTISLLTAYQTWTDPYNLSELWDTVEGCATKCPCISRTSA